VVALGSMSRKEEVASFLYEASMRLPFVIRGPSNVAVAERSFVRRFFTLKEMEQEFGGYLHGLSPEHSYLGVWSTRTCSRFRRLLRERGAEFNIVHELPHHEFRVLGQRISE
jgi:hypothetical protein